MTIAGTPGRVALWIGPLLMALVVTGCAGFQPFEPRNDRVEGPERGLFSGETGEFVIFRREAPDNSVQPAAVDEQPTPVP